MGEDLPLDPNLVQPPEEGQPDQQPQEGEAGHIEVSYQDDGQQQVDVAQHPAESGQADNGDPKPIGGTDPTQLTPEEALRSPNRIRNNDKAKAMATVEDFRGHYGYAYDNGRGHRELNGPRIESDVLGAGDDYEINEIAVREGKTPEQVKELMKSNRRAFLNYSHAIAENTVQYGDKLSPNLVVLAAVYDLAQKYPELMDSGYLGGDEVVIKIKHSQLAGGALDVEVSHIGQSEVRDEKIKEKWTAPVASSIDSWRLYSVTSLSQEDPEFEFETTTKQRQMREEDANNLKDLLAESNFDPDPENDRDYDKEDDYTQGDQSDTFAHQAGWSSHP